jgi:hypothetical protein
VIAAVVAIVTLALPVREVSSELVATMLIESGFGAEMGAVKTPVDVIVPHGDPSPTQAVPVVFHVTLWLPVPSTLATKDCVPPGARLALDGDTETTMCASTVICALAIWDGFATFAAERFTGFGDGTDAGARYSTLPAGAVVTTTHGFDATTQICPTLVLPPATSPTCHVTFVFVLPETLAVKICR